MLQKRLYNKVFKKLLKFFKQLLGRKVKGHFLSRIRTLTACITGMIRNKSSHFVRPWQRTITIDYSA